jgi:signal transduction histidine kinase
MNRLQRLLYSSTFRLGLLASVFIWIASSTVAIAIYHFTVLALIEEAGIQLDQEQSALLKGLDELAAEAEPSRWLYRRLSGQIAQTPYCLRLVDGEGEVMISNSKQEETPVFKNDTLFSIQRIQPDSTQPVRCLAREISLKDGGIFHFGIAFENTLNIISQLDKLRFWGLFISAGLALLIGSLISLRGLRGLQKINVACVHVAQGDLTHRIPVTDNNDDFDRLGETINTMLDQISQLMLGVSRVSDAIAHDLRTPLARMRSQIELMQQKSGYNDDQLDILSQQLDHILNAFNALLRISQLEQGSLRQAFSYFDFREVLNTALSLYELVFEEKSIQLHINQENCELPCFGDRDLWIQALSNLLDNAYKYTPTDGRVNITLKTIGQKIYLTVSDSGPGIPEAEHDNVFTRFYRLESHRSQSGTGLGLSLVRAVCNVHHASITLSDSDCENNSTGLSVTIATPMDSRLEKNETIQNVRQATA